MSKDTVGTEHTNTQSSNVSEIKVLTFTDMSMAIIPREAFEKLSECKTLVFINTKTIQIDADAWLGLSNLESLSIEGSSIRTLHGDTFNY